MTNDFYDKMKAHKAFSLHLELPDERDVYLVRLSDDTFNIDGRFSAHFDQKGLSLEEALDYLERHNLSWYFRGTRYSSEDV
jgi:hypothetical protein